MRRPARLPAAGRFGVDVGGNFGRFTLYSLALGCNVIAFEPVPAYLEVMRLGVSLNPGFADRLTLRPNVVYDTPGNYTLRVPLPGGKHRKKLGMTGMAGARGVLKSDFNAKAYTVSASSVRIDDLVSTDVCLLKADVEGYEPQVLQTAQRLLAQRNVASLQLELTRTPKSSDQTCAAIKMLEQLDALGYDFRQAPHALVDGRAPVGPWRSAPSAWDRLPPFPSDETRRKHAQAASGAKRSSRAAYEEDFETRSTNLVGRLNSARRPREAPPWPSLAAERSIAAWGWASFDGVAMRQSNVGGVGSCRAGPACSSRAAPAADPRSRLSRVQVSLLSSSRSVQRYTNWNI